MQSARACFISLFVLVGGRLPQAWCQFPRTAARLSRVALAPEPPPRPAPPQSSRPRLSPPASSGFHTRSCTRVTARLPVLPRLLPRWAESDLHTCVSSVLLLSRDAPMGVCKRVGKRCAQTCFPRGAACPGAGLPARAAPPSAGAPRASAGTGARPPGLGRRQPRRERNGTLRQRLPVWAPAPAELGLGAAWHRVAESSRVDFTQWERCSGSVVTMFAGRVKLAPKTAVVCYLCCGKLSRDP